VRGVPKNGGHLPQSTLLATGVSCTRHALANSGSIFSTAAMSLASFRARSVGFPLDMISTSILPKIFRCRQKRVLVVLLVQTLTTAFVQQPRVSGRAGRTEGSPATRTGLHPQ
jgi:hypothetical protein